MWHETAFQLIHTTADQSGVGSHFGSCSTLPFSHNSLQFYLLCLFYKIKTKEHSNLHKATLLRRFRFYVGEIQGFTIKYKDFSRLCEPCSKTTSKDELDIRRVTLKYFVKGFNFDALN